MLLAAAACLPAQARFTKDWIAVGIEGKPFTTFHYGEESGKPYLAPLRSPSGKIVTRRFPMEEAEGDSRDHVHHTGLWFSYDDVNGVKFWENDPSYNHPNMGRIVVRTAGFMEGDRSGALTPAKWKGRDLASPFSTTRKTRIALPIGTCGTTVCSPSIHLAPTPSILNSRRATGNCPRGAKSFSAGAW